ncbi:unnamed protein product [Linum tenue]|uniref:peptidylprolyl isomerase n=1 Tax=Linum tenue TaxID=586396 RepID=A0AAV0RMI7_9ROSI|nr:unnamed protein product [Linum tenue]
MPETSKGAGEYIVREERRRKPIAGEMRREMLVWVHPKCFLLFTGILILLIFAFYNSQTAEENREVEYEITHRVYLDIDIEEQRLGRIVIGLYGQVVPKTVENFRALCTGEKGTGANGKPLHYKGTPFHRIVSGFMIQGGDIVHGDGKGSESIYGGKFPDENFKVKHSHAGVVSMVNTGSDSNGSQFFITTIKSSWLDGEHVVFGKVVQGMDYVYAIEGGAGTYSGKPRKKVVIADSAALPRFPTSLPLYQLPESAAESTRSQSKTFSVASADSFLSSDHCRPIWRNSQIKFPSFSLSQAVMGSSSEEQEKRIAALYDPPATSSSSPTQPLLFKPPLDDEHTSDPNPESDPTQFLQISYNSGHRPFKDLPFLILFLLVLLSTLGLGIFSIVHRNPNYGSRSSFTFDSRSATCVPASPNSASTGGNFYYFLVNSLGSSGFISGLIWAIVITVILSGPICFLLLFSLRHYTKYLVYASLPFFIIMPVFFNVYWFVACTLSSSCSDELPLGYRIFVMCLIFVVIGVLVWVLVVNWYRVELTISIIGIAADALYKNLGLFVALPLLTFGLVVYYAPFVVFLVFARFNGKIVPKESNGEYHCGWKEDSWVPAYFTLGIVTLLWSSAIMAEAQVYVISGTIAQWYFSKDDSPPKRGIRTSLRNAFGPSSGSVCLSGLIIFIVRMVRGAVDSAKREDSPGMVNLVLRTCVNLFLSSIEFLNKFTINFVAITGEAYCTSARMTYELLKRNLLSAVLVEVISTRILAGITFVLSAVYAIVVCAILKGATSLGTDAYYVAILAWLVLIVVLGFFVHVLDNVVDTIYICYAIDKDRGEVYKSDVHEVYVHLPISRNQRPSLAPRTDAAV